MRLQFTVPILALVTLVCGTAHAARHVAFGLTPQSTFDVYDDHVPVALGIPSSATGALAFEAGAGEIRVVPAGWVESDTTAPAAVVDLAAGSLGTSEISLAWTATGDDGMVGTAARYELRWSVIPISDANWDSAQVVASPPAPIPAGGLQRCVLGGLAPGTLYYCAMRAWDEASNGSPLSNLAAGSTLSPAPPPPPPDDPAPPDSSGAPPDSSGAPPDSTGNPPAPPDSTGPQPPPPDDAPPLPPSALRADAPEGGTVTLRWDASPDADVVDYRILRSLDGGDPQVAADSVAALRWTDRTISPGHVYVWSILARDAAGNLSAPGPGFALTIPPPPPPENRLEGAAPNPTTGPVVLTFSLARSADVEVRLLDIAGRELRPRQQMRGSAGTNTWTIDLDNDSLPAGKVYVEFRIGGGNPVFLPVLYLRGRR